MNLMFWRKNRKDPRVDPFSYGNIAIELGYIDLHTLETALTIQDQRLGDVLVTMGAITVEQQNAIAMEQDSRKRAEKASPHVASAFRQHRTAMRALRSSVEKASGANEQFVTMLQSATALKDK